MIGAKGVDSCGRVATLLRPRNEVRRLKVAPRKAKPFEEINSGCQSNWNSNKLVFSSHSIYNCGRFKYVLTEVRSG
ncbi:hypothetical protein FZC75_16730 [Sutcliffiella horikoshii]|uniref:Uncharacterized protein n=1 Tax=Sutcliffiella horikoshii TaxID=79883 RepID=A0A5D4T4L2_9BACI|nr:hypothetical protein FZC75_16730 [Sutcliffiella horikoshii]